MRNRSTPATLFGLKESTAPQPLRRNPSQTWVITAAEHLRFLWQWSLLFAVLLVPKLSIAATPERWVTTWGSSQMRADGPDNLPKQTFDGATLRQVVRISTGGTKLRLRLSNAFGDHPLVLRSVYVAPSRSSKTGAVDPHLESPCSSMAVQAQ